MHTQTCKHDPLEKNRFGDHKCILPVQPQKPTPQNKTRPSNHTQERNEMLKPPNPKVPKNKTAPQRQHHKPRHVKDKPPDLERRPPRLRENEAHHGETVPRQRGRIRLAATKGKQHEDCWCQTKGEPDPSKLGRDPHEGGPRQHA